MNISRIRIRMLAIAILALAMSLLALPQIAMAADGELAAGSAGMVGAQAGTDYGFEYGYYDEYLNKWEDPQVSVEGVTSGNVSYDASSRMLVLNDVTAKSVRFSRYGENPGKEYSIKLVGSNFLSDGVGASVRGLTIDGPGSLTVRDAYRGIDVSLSGDSRSGNSTYLKVAGGNIDIVSTSGYGVCVNGGDLSMTGGKLSVLGAYDDAVDVEGYEYRGVRYGGRVSVIGGVLNATVFNPSRDYAIEAREVSNSLECLGSISGRLSEGASFAVKGNVYMVRGYENAMLVKYGSKSKKAKLEKVGFGNVSYEITAVGAKAFSTKAGKKVKSLSFGWLSYVGDKAFYGTKSLTKLTMFINLEYKIKSGKLKSVKLREGVEFSKSAFKKAGKSKGAGLKVELNNGVGKTDAPKYKKLLVKYGMPKKVELVAP